MSVREWSEEEFASSEGVWDDLLDRSDADPLFMSWGWQWRWWSHHARLLDAALHLTAVYAGQRLVALAPFYSHPVVIRGVLRTQRLELIGIAWRHPQALFSDYLDIIAARDCRDAVIEVLDDWLAAQPYWGELALCCSKRDGVAARLAVQRLRRWLHVREVDPLSSWCARLPSTFQTYVKQLPAEVRRKLFNQRRKLSAPRLEYARDAGRERALQELWRFSADRWGGGAPPAHIQSFHLDMTLELERSGELRLSRLVTAEGTLSALYNVQRRGTVYYLQSGFEASRARGLSPGYLHLGYAIEAACEEGAERFDLLAGRGRQRDYKRDLLTECMPVVSYHAVRGAIARSLYRAYGLIRGRRNTLRMS